MTEGLWSRALRAADARGLLPANGSQLTPAEIAAEVARRGEDRLATLVDAWYYPTSYGGVRGSLSDEEAGHVVAALEAEIAQAQPAEPAEKAPSIVETPAANEDSRCDLCGSPLRTL